MRTLIMCILLLIPTLIMANIGTLKGRIIDAKSKKGMEYVNIAIQDADTKEFLTGGVTDEMGDFYIGNLKEGTFIVKITTIGYTPIEKIFSLSAGQTTFDLTSIPLSEDTQLLDEVEIVGQRSQMRFEIDKRIFNVDQSIATAGGTASDVLGNVPSVEVDTEGEISLRGNSSVTVWINGRASGLTADNRAQILRQLPAESIEQIEVITNPSAKYNPEGTAGIINIVLKQNKSIGYYGSVQTGVDTRGGYHVSGNLNYSSGNWDTYLNLSYREERDKGKGYTYRDNLDENGNVVSFINQDNEDKDRESSYTGRAGVTYNFTPQNSLSLNFFGAIDKETEHTEMRYLSNMPNSFISSLRTSEAEEKMKMGNIELNYQHEFNENSNLEVVIARQIERGTLDNSFNQSYIFLENKQTGSYQFQQSKEPEKSWELQVDYVNKFGDNNKLEVGYKGDLTSEKSSDKAFSGASQETSIFNELLYNNFRYDQDVHAFYTTYSKRINNFGFQVGLRGEYTNTRIKSLGYNQNPADVQPFKDDYFSLYPSAFISYTLPQNNELQLNYTRRVSRPHGGQLNPFIDITDSMNISYGNPYLTPQYSNAVELNYIKNWADHTLSVSLYYRNTNDVIQRINYREDNIMKGTYENVAKTEATGFELIMKNNLFRILDLTTSVNLYYNKLGGFSYVPSGVSQPVYGESDSDFSWDGRIVANAILPYDMSIQATGRYNSGRIVAQGKMDAMGTLDLGIRKSFLDKKLSLTVTAHDIFNTRKWAGATIGNGFRQATMRSKTGQIFGFTLTYSFGNLNKGKKVSNGGDIIQERSGVETF
ncbi:TonB-dependent receptor [Parabacteroides sp. PF5-9]|uniref:TonB-dependent receptor domain-containing protein n=1 Tax=Parabacteroides sp. PF5-9 TaxID=1742404 RepID=UPI0024748FDE|nr:TonB-dependent receptor [Parabacteroides sp. PF5-9]MDH6356613.1 outer membrane receptor protein involved in Fe transport [Parabacteroides sp. PF5-9]